MTITWQGFLVLAGAIITILGAWRAIVTLKKDIVVSIQKTVCDVVDARIAPFVSNQADVLRYSITRAHSQYTEEGSINKYTLQALESLYRAYHGMNQNGFVDTLMHELRELPEKTGYVTKFVKNKRVGVVAQNPKEGE